MGLYGRFILPKLVNLACRTSPITRQRRKVIPKATGTVLELGFGSGLNLPFYDASQVRQLLALEPSKEMWSLAEKGVRSTQFEVERLEASAEEVPLGDGTADTVVATYTLCTIPDLLVALSEIRRVLKPGGTLVFCEHGAAPDEEVRRWQDRLNPIWSKLAGGCNLNRPIPSLLEESGFKIQEMETMYLPGWRPANFNYWGIAVSVQGGAG
jgi:ubiquinone/menaquinone biosynthesis C-methylase UbiE